MAGAPESEYTLEEYREGRRQYEISIGPGEPFTSWNNLSMRTRKSWAKRAQEARQLLDAAVAPAPKLAGRRRPVMPLMARPAASGPEMVWPDLVKDVGEEPHFEGYSPGELPAWPKVIVNLEPGEYISAPQTIECPECKAPKGSTCLEMLPADHVFEGTEFQGSVYHSARIVAAAEPVGEPMGLVMEMPEPQFTTKAIWDEAFIHRTVIDAINRYAPASLSTPTKNGLADTIVEAFMDVPRRMGRHTAES